MTTTTRRKEQGQGGSSGADDEGFGVVDMAGPMVPQVWKLGDKYWAWVHKASTQKSYRLFAGDLYETFSWTPWWVIPVVWFPIIAALSLDALGLAFSSTPLSPMLLLVATSFEQAQANSSASTAASAASNAPAQATHVSVGTLDTKSFATVFVLGAVMWTFLEYALHRFLFHILFLPSTAFGKQAHFVLHGQHHKFPMDKGRLVFPPVAGLMMATPFYLTFHFTMAREVANALTAGALVGYVAYDLIHYYLHHGRPRSKYFLRLKHHHMRHHFKDADRGFGISSKLWDFPFCTLFPDVAKAKPSSTRMHVASN